MNGRNKLAAVLLLLTGCGSEKEPQPDIQSHPGTSPFKIHFEATPKLPPCRKAWRQLIPKGQHVHRTGEPYQEFTARVDRKKCQKKWTVLVYMGADNDLAPYAFWDLFEMEAGVASGRRKTGSTLRTDYLVQLDTPNNDGQHRFHVFQSPEIYPAKKDQYRRRINLQRFRGETISSLFSPVVQRVGEEDKTQIQNFADFLKWGTEEYPSEHYMVILWGHGMGFSPTGQRYEKNGGVVTDATQRTKMNIQPLGQLVRQFSRARGKRLDLLVWDACLMQTMEVAGEFSDSVRFVTGSAQVQNFLGLPYRTIFRELNERRFAGLRHRYYGKGYRGPLDEPKLLAEMIPGLYAASFGPNGYQGRTDKKARSKLALSTLSMPDFQEKLLPALRKFSRHLIRGLRQPAEQIKLLQRLQDQGTYASGQIDMGVWLKALDPTPPWLLLALERTILSRYVGKSYWQNSATRSDFPWQAVSVWLPQRQEAWLAGQSVFFESQFTQHSGWHNWLHLLHD